MRRALRRSSFSADAPGVGRRRSRARTTIDLPPIETLEIRHLLSAALWAAPTAAGSPLIQQQTPGLAYTPAQADGLLGMTSLPVATGLGQKVALVEPFGEPDIADDLSQFDSQFALPAPPSLSQISLAPPPSAAAVDGWSLETALDVEWVHATAPAAGLVLVVANSSNPSDLVTATQLAQQTPGVTAVFANEGSGSNPAPSVPPGDGDDNVLFMSSPASGYAVFDSAPSDGRAGWWSLGGDRAQSPQGVGMVAAAQQSGALVLADGGLTPAQATAVAVNGYTAVLSLGSVTTPAVSNFPVDAPPPDPALHQPHLLNPPQGNLGNAPARGKPTLLHGAPPPVIVAQGHALTPLAQLPGVALAGPSNAASQHVDRVAAPAVVADVSTGAGAVSADSQHGSFVAGIAISPDQVAALAQGAVTLASAAGTELAMASNHAADALAIVASAQPLADVVSYNFVHFNPGVMLHDTIASFSQESAMAFSSTPLVAQKGGLAWTVTMAVIAGDLFFVGYWYHRARCYSAHRRGRMRVAGLEIEPCAGRLL